ncbi:hypothetical protein CVT26_011327 [Gymnopilus dilepis]|uniref:Uncharacterized protein n=1 Tax=Gymnopilus dilepis TaxID=231916 RepID=A0A409X4N0_9AGAR|nr:hypothetical protein CVT26_011327 [Gymnopilus dilepis]
MPNLLTQHELERRLLRWTGSSLVPRYPFFDSPSSSHTSYSYAASQSHLASGSIDDLNRWLYDVELAAHDCDIPMEQYTDVAIFFLKGDLNEVMQQRRSVYLGHTRRVFWEWADFKEDLKRVVEETNQMIGAMVRDCFGVLKREAAKMLDSPQIANLANDAIEQLRRAHPYIASSIKLGLIVGGTAVVLPALGMMTWNKLLRRQSGGPKSSLE